MKTNIENKKIAVVLVNYHDYAKRFLKPCRDSLRKQSLDSNNFQVYIVDNDSSEETYNYLINEYPEAIVLKRSDGNYAAANNLGFRKGIEDGAHYLVALNMDTEVEPDFLKELSFALDNDDKAAMAQAKILLYPKTEAERKNPKINSLGNIIQFLGFGFTSSYGELDRNIDGYPEIKGYVSGCAFIIRKNAFIESGGLNEEFYMYHDDIELSLKIRLLGYKMILAPKAVVFHKYEFERSVRMFYYMERNRYLTLFIFSSKRYLALILLPLLFMDLAMFFYAILNGYFKELLKVYAYFLSRKNINRMFDDRKKLQKMKKVKFSKIARTFQARIRFQEIANPVLKYIANPAMTVYWAMIKYLI